MGGPMVVDFEREDAGRSRRASGCRSPAVISCGWLEVEAYFGVQGTWGQVVRAAEGGEKVVEGVFVGDVDAGETQAPLVFVACEEVVYADGGVEDVAGGDAGWVLVVILGVGGGDAEEAGTVLGGEALAVGDALEWCGFEAITGKAGFELLVGGEAADIDAGLAVDGDRCWAAEGVRADDVVAGC